MSKSVKQYIRLIKERKSLAEEIISTFETHSGWQILFPPRATDKLEQLTELTLLLNRMVAIDCELSDLETSDIEPDYPDEPTDEPPTEGDEDWEPVEDEPLPPLDDEPIEDNPSTEEPITPPIEDTPMDTPPIGDADEPIEEPPIIDDNDDSGSEDNDGREEPLSYIGDEPRLEIISENDTFHDLWLKSR